MNKGCFLMCAGCSRKVKRNGLKKGEYYCDVAECVVSNGVVTDDMDATNCVKNGCYQQKEESE